MKWFLPTLPSLISVVVMGTMAVFVRWKLKTAAARAFSLWLALSTLTTTLFGLSIAVQDPAAKFYLLNLRDAPLAFIPIATLWFVYQLTGNPPRRLRLWLILVAIPPTIGLALTLTSPWHHLSVFDMTVDPRTLTPTGQGGLWHRIGTAFGTSVYWFALATLARSAWRAPAPFRQQQWLFFWANVPPAITRFLFFYGISLIPGYNLTPIFMSAGCAVFAYALVWRRFLDIAPIARQHIVELVSDLMLVVDTQGRLVDLNEASRRVFRLSTPAALGQPFTAILPSLAAFLPKEGSVPVFARVEVVLDDQGVLRTYELTTSTVRDTRGTTLGVALVLHDVTELKQRADAAQQEARRHEELSRLKDGFVATVSHELRTPLNAIIGLTDVLLDEQLPVEVRRYVKTIHSSGEVLLSLINDVLDLAKIKAGKVELERMPFSVLRSVETAASLFAVTCETKGLELSWYVPPELPLLEGDPARVRQILLNLVGNAVKFTQRGEIQVTAAWTPSPPRLEIQVTDTGPGVPVDKRESIFQEFTQVDTSTTRNAGGTGLGLPIVRQIARLMGGDVTCGENPRGGSCFSLTLALGVPSPSAPRSASGSLRPLARRPTIIACVEHPLRRRHLSEWLLQIGAQVVEAAQLHDVGPLVPNRPGKRPDPRTAVVIDVPGLTPGRLAESSLVLAGMAVAPMVLLLDSASLLRDGAAYRALGIHELLQRPGRLHEVQESLERLDLGRPVTPSAEAPALAAAHTGTRRRVLVVDDVDENRLLMAAYLKRSEVEVDYAADGAQGLQRFQSVRYDIVFLDIEMPVLDGYAAVRGMRSWESQQGHPPAPIIAMTAHQGGEHRRRSDAAGFTHHLDKPVRKREVLQLLDLLAPVAAAGAERTLAVEPVDPAVKELQSQYVANRYMELAVFREWLQGEDYSSLRRLGHNLRGSGTAYGFPQLTSLGQEIEEAAELRRLESLVALAARYEQAVATLTSAQAA